MTPDELGEVVDGISDAVREHVDRLFAGVLARVNALEERSLVPGPQGPSGPAGSDGKSFDASALAEIRDEILGHVEHVRVKLAALEQPSVDIDAIVTRAAASVERPRDGRDGVSVTVEDVRPVIAAEVQKAVDGIRPPKDGVGLAAGLIDRDGDLWLTLTDGTLKNLGRVAGRDGGRGEKGEPGVEGQPGQRGPAGEPGERGEKGEPGIAGQPGPIGPAGDQGERGEKGLDGAHGQDGRDGVDGITLDIDDLTAANYDGERTVELRFQRGEHTKTFPIKFAAPLYRDVFAAGTVYEPGDMVTYAGGLWIAKATTSERPGDGVTGWRLCAKKGRDGKAGAQGPQGLPGPRGDRGDKW